MKAMKKGLGLLLVAVLLAGCGTSGGETDTTKENAAEAEEKVEGTDNTETAEDYEKVVYAYATFNNIPDNASRESVEEAINEITREKIGVEVELMPISIFEYSQTVSLALQGGDKIDVFQSLGDYNTSVSSNMAYDITEMIDEYAAGAKEIVGETFLSAAMQEGSLYGIPSYKPYALTPMVIYRQDIADEIGLDMDQVKTLSDVTDALAAVKEAKPDMVPLVPVETGSLGTVLCIEEVDFLSDDYTSPKGVVLGDNTEVVDFYATDEFMEICTLARNWYEEGLVLKDAATTTSAAAESMSSGNSFAYIASYSYSPEDTAASLEAQCGGYSLGAVQIGDAYLDTSSINALTWMVSSTTDVPEAALKFLDLTFSDEEVINLLIYGIEGRDYVKNDDGTVGYPEGEDASTVPYTAQLSCGTLGNYFSMYTMEGTDPDAKVWEEQQNNDAKTSYAMGFTFNSEALNTEYTAVTNVISQYMPGLVCGSVDPETTIPEFLDRLESAGMQSIVEAKQEQLNAWLAEQ